MNLGRYVKALIPAVGSIFTVLYGWAATGRWDVPTLRWAAVGLVYALVVYLLPNAPVPAPPVELSTMAEPVRSYANDGWVPNLAGIIEALPRDGEAMRASTGHGIAGSGPG